MKNIKGTQIIIWLLAIAPLFIIGFFIDSLPAQIPVHWSLDGSVQYGSQFNLWVMGSMGVLFAILFPVLRKIDPKRKNYDKFGKYYDEFQIFMMLFFIALIGITISESINPGKLNVELIVVLLVGILFTIIGNMMPKFKNNFFVGIKTPWTLMNTEVWNKTHRLGGILWFFGGIIIIASAFLLRSTGLFAVVTGVTLVISLVPVVMSYIWYRDLKSRGEEKDAI